MVQQEKLTDDRSLETLWRPGDPRSTCRINPGCHSAAGPRTIPQERQVPIESASGQDQSKSESTMTKFLISFPASAMQVPAEDMAAVSEASRGVIREAKAAGIYVFGGGINADVPTTMVAANGICTFETYSQTAKFDGGFCVLELPSREAAIEWAARLASACRCAQELREFYYDPES